MITLKYADQMQGSAVGDEFQSLIAQLNAVLRLTADGQLALTSIGTTGGTSTVSATLTAASRGVIKSIQRGTVTIATLSATGTVTISSVDPNKTRLHFLGWSTDSVSDVDTRDEVPRIALTNATTITATRGNAGAPVLIVSWEAIEEN